MAAKKTRHCRDATYLVKLEQLKYVKFCVRNTLPVSLELRAMVNSWLPVEKNIHQGWIGMFTSWAYHTENTILTSFQKKEQKYKVYKKNVFLLVFKHQIDLTFSLHKLCQMVMFKPKTCNTNCHLDATSQFLLPHLLCRSCYLGIRWWSVKQLLLHILESGDDLLSSCCYVSWNRVMIF